MADFNQETKKEVSNNQYFGEGVHVVTILGITSDTSTDKEFWKVELEGENGEEGDARLYWTEKAAPYSFNTIRQIFVHNTVDANKDKIRATVDATNNTAELLKLSQSLIGKKAWYKVEKSGGQYLGSDGTMKDSYNKNLFGYEPKMKKVTADDLISQSTPAEQTDIDAIPFE